MTTITVIESNDLPISFSKIAGLTLEVKKTNIHEFASGTQKYFVVEHRARKYAVPERFTKKFSFKNIDHDNSDSKTKSSRK